MKYEFIALLLKTHAGRDNKSVLAWPQLHTNSVALTVYLSFDTVRSVTPLV